MGNQPGSISKEQLEELVGEGQVTESDIRFMYNQFSALDKDKSMSLTREEIMRLPQFRTNPLASRLIEVIDADGDGHISFFEFVKTVSTFTQSSETSDKLDVIFKIYDVDGDGFVSSTDLFKALKIMVGSNLRDRDVYDLVHQTIVHFDADHDGLLSKDEFKKAISSTPLIEKVENLYPRRSG